MGWFNHTPEIWHQPFLHEGFYVADLPPSLPGELFHTQLDEGSIWFQVGVLYRPDTLANKRQYQGLLRNQLEVILCLSAQSDRPALAAMWEYDVFTREMPNGSSRVL